MLELEATIESCRLDIIAIQEHWMGNECGDFIINNMSVVSFFARKNRANGGVCIMLRKDLKYVHVNDIDRLAVESSFEVVAVKLVDYNLIIVSMYRPPNGDMSIYHERLDSLLSCLQNSKASIMIGGGFNIHFNVKNDSTEQTVDTFGACGLTSVVDFQTRGKHFRQRVY